VQCADNVCVLVMTEPCKTAEPIYMPLGGADSHGPKESWVEDPLLEGTLLGGTCADPLCIEKYREVWHGMRTKMCSFRRVTAVAEMWPVATITVPGNNLLN